MDYDVAAIALATPPASAPVQSFRPAVAVKNLGIHDADVTGTLSIYDRAAGTLITTMNLAANNIAPGETRNAVANQLWEPTPADIGHAFLFTAVIVYPPDQNLTNNNLQPVTVIVTAAPPTPPPPVEAHADQHEDGGGDQVNVEGLSGKLAEAQTPAEHASNHEDGGADQLDVAGLVGELATPQTPKLHASTHQVGGTDAVTGIEPGAHASSHEPGGSDEIAGIEPGPHAPTHSPEGGDPIDVTGMPGLLADNQNPTSHKASHEVGGVDAISVNGLSGTLTSKQNPTDHGSASHDATVEAVANKGQNSGYCGLSATALVPAANTTLRGDYCLNSDWIDTLVRCNGGGAVTLLYASGNKTAPADMGGAHAIYTGFVDTTNTLALNLNLTIKLKIYYSGTPLSIGKILIKHANCSNTALPFSISQIFGTLPAGATVFSTEVYVQNDDLLAVDVAITGGVLSTYR